MAQRIILIHGRSTKPARQPYEALQFKALVQGLNRVDPAKAARVAAGEIPVEFIYYGDVNNRILAAQSANARKKLTATDPDFGNAPCVPHQSYDAAIDALAGFTTFNRAAYRRILRDNLDLRLVDDLATAISTFAAVTTGTFLNRAVIRAATGDMGAYLTTRAVGSHIRARLQTVLKPALLGGDDVCLIAHSMGCMVSYDVLWKFSRMSEYRDVQDTGNKVSLWLTLGCPLGEAGVKANLRDANAYNDDIHPKQIIGDWVNIAAHDDFVSHDQTMRNDYRKMRHADFGTSISDKRIYNCYAHGGKSNPHKMYGYLANPITAKAIADWVA